ncbi:MAG TPA: TatD family hydrolase, partial [Candidatus Nanoarchaeia archaeon]|nr:TatD family hydrolase [Candidatus Nanoarchaeia archaeon]
IKKNESKIIAVGEVGLDFKEDEKQHERQKKIFSKIIDTALEIDKPLIIHSRKAEAEVIEMLEQAGVKKVQMHCFCGKMSLIKRIVSNGWFLSIPTNVKYASQFQETVKEVPIENLLCETDAPYLHPEKERDNEPALVIESYKKIAEIKKISLEDAVKAINKNYTRLFLD